ncbi:MAG: glycosyltransferase [Nitrososphaeria archaeon]
MGEPYISVIVPAHNRRKYLLGAVNSILSQNFPRHLYEIIVVKNLRDEAIDSKLQEWGVVNLYSDQRGLGAKIVEALGIARGDVISFLEDETSSCRASINAFTHPSR